jgi:hypothetical protein
LFPDGLVGIMRRIQERIHNMRVIALSAEEGLR